MKEKQKIILFNIANFILNLFRAIEKFLGKFVDRICDYIELVITTITKIVEIILLPILLILILPLFIIKIFLLLLTKILDTILYQKYCLTPENIKKHYKFLKDKIEY